MCRRWKRRYPCDPVVLKQARDEILTTLVGWGVGSEDPAFDAATDTLLITEELLSNAMKWCDRPVGLQLVAHHDSLRVTVVDDSPQAAVPHPVDVDDPHLGLVIVEALSAGWGQFRFAHGKAVWSKLTVPPGSALGRECRRAAPC